MVFFRSSDTVNVTVTTKTLHQIYVFNVNVLLILLIPALAALLGTFMWWRIVGNGICPGYDPVEIARCGPV